MSAAVGISQPLQHGGVPRRRRVTPKKVVFALLITAGTVLFISPLIVILLTSITSQQDLIQHGPANVPNHVALNNYPDAWTGGNLWSYYRNTILISIVKVPLGILLASLAAYPIAHMRFLGRKTVFVMILVGLGVPQVITLFPLLRITSALGMHGTLWVLLLPYLAFGFPFSVLVMRGAFAGVPRQLVEAARIDRASEFFIWWRICMPLVLPTLAALVILDGVATWNEFVIALTLINSQSTYTLPLGIFNLQGQFQQNYPQLAAGVVICVIPMVLVFVLARKYLTTGVSAGAVKE